jgi:hypothetical protein
MKLNIFWGQQNWETELREQSDGSVGTTPLSILEDIGEAGRCAFIEILTINYRKELEQELKQIKRF